MTFPALLTKTALESPANLSYLENTNSVGILNLVKSFNNIGFTIVLGMYLKYDKNTPLFYIGSATSRILNIYYKLSTNQIVVDLCSKKWFDYRVVVNAFTCVF